MAAPCRRAVAPCAIGPGLEAHTSDPAAFVFCKRCRAPAQRAPSGTHPPALLNVNERVLCGGRKCGSGSGVVGRSPYDGAVLAMAFFCHVAQVTRQGRSADSDPQNKDFLAARPPRKKVTPHRSDAPAIQLSDPWLFSAPPWTLDRLRKDSFEYPPL